MVGSAGFEPATNRPLAPDGAVYYGSKSTASTSPRMQKSGLPWPALSPGQIYTPKKRIKSCVRTLAKSRLDIQGAKLVATMTTTYNWTTSTSSRTFDNLF
jgi:hypothetical protein